MRRAREVKIYREKHKKKQKNIQNYEHLLIFLFKLILSHMVCNKYLYNIIIFIWLFGKKLVQSFVGITKIKL